MGCGWAVLVGGEWWMVMGDWWWYVGGADFGVL